MRELALQVAKANAGLIKSRLINQLEVGEDGEGQKIGLYKYDYYADFKQRIGSNAPRGVVDLKLTGKLYEGINVKFTESEVTADSKVSYSKYQVDRYGNEIYELQDDNKEDVKFSNSKKIAQRYKELLGI